MTIKFKKKVNDVLGNVIHHHHLLPLFSRQATPSTSSTGASKCIPSTTELIEAGVKFKVKENATSFLDVTFHDGVMEIPSLKLGDNSESQLRNLIAFEQCYPNTTSHVVFYAFFMDFLVNSPQDILILQHKEIILNWLSGEEEATQLFNQLVIQVNVNSRENYLSGLYNEVTIFCGLRRNKYRASLMRNQFNTERERVHQKKQSMNGTDGDNRHRHGSVMGGVHERLTHHLLIKQNQPCCRPTAGHEVLAKSN
ncbi:putative UPF0481 protein [Acorus calamus]|uniref:UPF0481 protein n=1 Tax=Acorus calamus TaxID=4465 RepID=A0AAV9F1F6_ACOCL|nr:putative UPF0481 protein [Acorus calamus]